MLYKRLTGYMVMVLFSSGLVAEVSVKPINPEFVKWQEEKERTHTSDIVKLQTPSGIRATGWRPSPMAEEIHKSYQGDILKLGIGFPEKFDLSDPNLDLNRADSLLTPVKDQGQCGVCWAFAAYGAYEGQPKIDGLGTFDFSEQHLRYTNGTEWSNDDPCSGGNLPMVTAYLVRGDGAVSESDDPYDLSSGNTYNPEATAMRYVDNILELPVRDLNHKTDINYLKDALSTLERPLYVSIQVGSGTAGETGESVWDSATKSFYCDGGGLICQSNHAVVIVGWDDTYVAQGQTGAFIVRNSWGSTWAGDGHFYVPYNDDSIALSGTVAYFEDKDDDELGMTKIYQHDVLPAIRAWGYSDSTPYWGANKYSVENDGVVTAIGFYATGSGTQYEIKIFKSIIGSGSDVTFSNQVGTTQSSGSAIQRGWHTIKLETPVSITEGETLVAQVKLSNPNGWPLPIEGDISGYVDAEYSAGESFWSSNGTNFQDVSVYMADYITDPNIAIKVLVDESQTPPVPNSPIVPIISYILL